MPMLHSAFRLPRSALTLARVTASTLGGLLFPLRCLACGRDLPETDAPPGTARRSLCGDCQAAADDWTLRPPCCAKCSEPFDGAMGAEPADCWNCRGQEFAFTRAVSARRSRGLVHETVLRFKYRGEFALRHPLAEWLTEAILSERLRARPTDPSPDALVPVPLHAKRRRERGFNQADVLARLAGPRVGLPTLSGVLRRVRETETQTHLSRAERLRNLRGAFAVRSGAAASKLAGRHLLLVDDVFTTGSTAHECARTLLDAGAASVGVVTVGRR